MTFPRGVFTPKVGRVAMTVTMTVVYGRKIFAVFAMKIFFD